jgi:hypothetical protein
MDGATDHFGAGGRRQLGQLFKVLVGRGDGPPGEVHADEIRSLHPSASDEFKRGSLQGRRPPILWILLVSMVFLGGSGSARSNYSKRGSRPKPGEWRNLPAAYLSCTMRVVTERLPIWSFT